MMNSLLASFKSFLLISTLVCSFLVSTQQTAQADGFIRDGLGARTIGRGGINLGFSDNGQIVLDNAAAIVNMDTLTLTDFGIDLLITDLKYEDPDNPRTSAENNPIPVGQFAIAYKSRDQNIGWGLGVFSQAGFGAEYTLNGPAPFHSGPEHYKSFGALVRILPAVSVRLTPRLSVGANLGVAVNHMELEGPYTLQGPSAFAGTPTKFDLQATGAALSWATSLQYMLTPQTTLGVNYQDQSRFELDGNTRVSIPGLGDARFDSRLKLRWPRSLGGGVKHQLNQCTTVGVDVIWYNWSDAFTTFDNTLSNPDNPTIAAVVGNQLQENLPVNWRDTVSVRTGIERKLGGGRTLRGGYIYHRNPIPDGTVSPYIQATLEHAFSLGYGWQMMGCEIDTAYQFSFSPDQTTGTSQFIGGDFDNATSTVKAHWISLSAIRRF